MSAAAPRSLPAALLLVAVASLPTGLAVRSPTRVADAIAAAAACGELAYTEFRRRHAADEAAPPLNTSDGDERQALFVRRCKEVMEHNARAGAKWTASVNHFADRTDAELRALLGHKPGNRRGEQHHGALSTFRMSSARVGQGEGASTSLPETVDWRSRLASAKFIRNQGSCGSCWAMASAGAVEMHAELADGRAEEVAASHLVRCVPNPRRCGGSGGCEGATAELAFEFIQRSGVMLARGDTGTCKADGPHVMVGSFVQLPVNRAEPFVRALASQGPLTVGVDASSWWNYHSGIFDGCDRDAIVNHAVLAVGYTKDAYIIRNSWGALWGEAGHIRLQRLDQGGDGYCGMDRSPQEGSACEDGPSVVTVCGMCGVLSDVAYPLGVHFVDGAELSSAGPAGSAEPAVGSGLKRKPAA